MSYEITTTDLSKFGFRELRMAAELLTALTENGAPDDFELDGVTVMFNTHSGNVFLTNSEYQVAMVNGDKLESWYTCSYCGEEGFAEDITLNDEGCESCHPTNGEDAADTE